ncbi:peptide chain release factor 1 [Desulfonauticus submarinus]|uniref:Peptide chain release factor 1 n=1 Tax=Desulfonauticus submarinus TaxID=206665 RepID=A0A1H0BCL4_9BACT|nr:peptide chain release factor 1 [Desulfonauticus submarinus]SDN43369.1 peptide chain release factor 1 [Desulfonauticus submarinus]
MLAKLESLEQKFLELEKELSSPDIFQDQEKYKKISKAHSELQEIVSTYREYKKILNQIKENQELLKDKDPEIRELAEEEIKELKPQQKKLEDKLKILLIPKDPLDEKNIILEIRAGTGGEEAALFAADLFRMYSRYAENKGWKVEIMDAHETGTGGFKEVIANISGKQVYSRLKFESGVHRVQRVPATESQGRIHTSAVTVAILPEAEEIDIHIDPNELRIDVFRSSGPGGQSVNTTDSAVRITHIPTGLVVTCQDEKSQHKNKAKALKVLRARLLQIKQEEQKKELDENRRSQVGSGDRSERIRTYNFPQGRVTDHRINLTIYNLDAILEGELDQVIDPLIQHFQTEALKQEASI